MNAVRLRPTPACVLFDLDGTLVDTAPDLGLAANRIRADHGLPPLAIDAYRPVASSGARGLLGVGMNLTPADAAYPAQRDRFLAYYREHLTATSVIFPGVAELLAGFDRRGLRWGIVTNKAGWLARPLVEQLGLAARAACVVGGDDAPRAKPHPDTLLLACAQVGISPAAAVYVGDDERDIQAARAAGMPSVAAGWGYLGTVTPVHEWGADHLVASVFDLSTLLE